MNRDQSSYVFWIIFLVIVAGIAILIFPRYGTLSRQITTAQSRNIASKLTAASAANYTQRKTKVAMGKAIINCTDVKNIAGADLPMGYQINNQTVASDTVAVCTLVDPNGRKIEFSIVGIH